ncbi:hypothetical protein BGAL_0326g00140 [Botrytis galanthina]|uniref:Uncharacterized protein n=1 Tax=Botrytis galanthina TaxID=278940 RepID=A0A4S8QUN4_9HELO|nr:hypothetical protein BGAL_0326g00140 [Botrytis galanthina]
MCYVLTKMQNFVNKTKTIVVKLETKLKFISTHHRPSEDTDYDELGIRDLAAMKKDLLLIATHAVGTKCEVSFRMENSSSNLAQNSFLSD